MDIWLGVVGLIVTSSKMSGRTVLPDVSSHILEVKTTDVTITRPAHFESSKTSSPLVCDCVFISLRC